MDFFLQTFNILVDLLLTMIFIRAILSWMVPSDTPVTHFLEQCTEPLLSPVRRLLPRMGGLDLSALVVMVLLQFLRNFINHF